MQKIQPKIWNKLNFIVSYKKRFVKDNFTLWNNIFPSPSDKHWFVVVITPTSMIIIQIFLRTNLLSYKKKGCGRQFHFLKQYIPVSPEKHWFVVVITPTFIISERTKIIRIVSLNIGIYHGFLWEHSSLSKYSNFLAFWPVKIMLIFALWDFSFFRSGALKEKNLNFLKNFLIFNFQSL